MLVIPVYITRWVVWVARGTHATPPTHIVLTACFRGVHVRVVVAVHVVVMMDGCVVRTRIGGRRLLVHEVQAGFLAPFDFRFGVPLQCVFLMADVLFGQDAESEIEIFERAL